CGYPAQLTDVDMQLLCVYGQPLRSDHDQGHNDQDHHFGAVDTQHASKSTVEAGSIDSWSAQVPVGDRPAAVMDETAVERILRIVELIPSAHVVAYGTVGAV